jgi:desumoylating isopeptidase 1
MSELDAAMLSAKDSCAVVFFTSSTCGPCKDLYPVYDELSVEAGDRALLVKIDINFAQDIVSKYKVHATPTIMTFFKGEKDEEWAGADVQRLRTTVERLIRMAHPPHPHTKIPVHALVVAAGNPVRFTKIPPLDKLIPKLGAAANDPIIPSMKVFLSNLTSTPSQGTLVPFYFHLHH